MLYGMEHLGGQVRGFVIDRSQNYRFLRIFLVAEHVYSNSVKRMIVDKK
jgi:hypothetical protein